LATAAIADSGVGGIYEIISPSIVVLKMTYSIASTAPNHLLGL
jgi:hypothetical protein